MAELLKNEYFVWGVMAVIVVFLTQVFKLPIKALTKKYIKNRKVKDRVNVCIMLLPIIWGVVLDFLYCTLLIKTAFSVLEGVKVGTTAIMLYGILEKFFTGKQSKETDEALKLAQEIVKDGKIDKDDEQIVKEFINKVH